MPPFWLLWLPFGTLWVPFWSLLAAVSPLGLLLGPSWLDFLIDFHLITRKIMFFSILDSSRYNLVPKPCFWGYDFAEHPQIAVSNSEESRFPLAPRPFVDLEREFAASNLDPLRDPLAVRESVLECVSDPAAGPVSAGTLLQNHFLWS